MSIAYLTGRYLYPTPIINVRLKNVEGAPSTDVYSAIIDTGADMSVAPLGLVKSVDAKGFFDGRFITHWDDVHYIPIYVIDIEIEGVLLPGGTIGGDDESTEIVLGRNILNKIPLFLDGPKQQTHLLDDASANRLRGRRSR